MISLWRHKRMISKPSRTVVLLALILSHPGTVGAEMPTLQTITKEADRAWHTNVARWADHSFERHVTRLTFDKNGETTFRQEKRFRVRPDGDGFDEELLEIDGREPTEKEVKKNRRDSVFSKHYRQAGDLNLKNPLGEDLALLPIIQDQDHHLVGEEEVDGIPCYRTTFDARDEPDGVPIRERLKYSIKGSACFSKDGYHLVQFEMETVRALKKSGVAMNYLHMTIQGHPVGDAWLPKTVELRSDVFVLGKRLRKANLWAYSDFTHEPARKP